MIDDEERAFRAELAAEPGLFTQFGALFVGPIGKWTMLAYGMAIVLFLLGIWTALRMIDAPSPRGALLWFTATLACWSSVVTIKLWIWNRNNTLAILRALARRARG